MMSETYAEVIKALLDTAHRFYKLKYQMSDGGNLSIRLPRTNRMLVKGSGVDFGSLDIATLAIADFEGNAIGGTVAPSKECRLHGALYKAMGEIGAIVHCHSPWATAWAARHNELFFSTYHAREKLGGYCPVFDTGSYVVGSDHVQTIVNVIRQQSHLKAFLLRGHGQVALGKDIRDAAMTAELVEETAKIAILSGAEYPSL